MDRVTPLNNGQRSKAIRNFLGIYGLSLFAVLAMSFFLFRTPSRVYKNKTEAFTLQHRALVDRTTSITKYISGLVEAKNAVNPGPNPGLDSLINEHRESITQAVLTLKNDSLKKAYPLLQEDVKNYLGAYNALLYFANKTERPAVIEAPVTRPVTDGKTPSRPDSTNYYKYQYAQLQSELKRALEENNSIKRNLPKPTPDFNTVITKLEKERDACKVALENTQADVRSQDITIKNREKQIQDLDNRVAELLKSPNRESGSTSATKLTETEKAQLTFQVVSQITRRGSKNFCSEMNGILAGLKKSLPNDPRVDEKIKELKKACDVF